MSNKSLPSTNTISQENTSLIVSCHVPVSLSTISKARLARYNFALMFAKYGKIKQQYALNERTPST